jgi:beta-aspartyl-peptidase (threonine type)
MLFLTKEHAGAIMKNTLILFLVVFLATQAGFSKAPDYSEEILDVLAKQKTAWNRGDIEGFMKYYWRSKDFTFQSGNSRIRGWETLFARYKKNYSGENWGTLDFKDLVVKALSENTAFVLGRWEVKRKDEVLGGLFTLILHRKPEGWRIIHDHTSS